MIKWAGVSSDELGLVVQHFPRRYIPKRKIEVESVPGRNEDIIYSQDAFENYEQPYSVFIDARSDGVPDHGRLDLISYKITDWLLGNPGYQRLEDSYEPMVYRRARFDGGTEFTNMFNEYGAGTLTFICAPQRFLKSGEFPIEIKIKYTKIKNPTAFEARPFIRLYGDGTCYLKFNTTQVMITEVSEYVDIDVEARSIMKGTTNYSSKFTGKFEDLVLKGMTEISWSSGSTKVEITPRWWAL